MFSKQNRHSTEIQNLNSKYVPKICWILNYFNFLLCAA